MFCSLGHGVKPIKESCCPPILHIGDGIEEKVHEVTLTPVSEIEGIDSIDDVGAETSSSVGCQTEKGRRTLQH